MVGGSQLTLSFYIDQDSRTENGAKGPSTQPNKDNSLADTPRVLFAK